MKSFVVAYCATLLALVGIDFVWLSVAAERLYRPALKSILLDGFRPTPAIAFYLIYAVGLVIFALRPGLAADSPRLTLLNGALFGLCAYATYDLTNLATLRDWTISVTFADLGWGIILSAIAAVIGYAATKTFCG